jgi:hypothetical protein
MTVRREARVTEWAVEVRSVQSALEAAVEALCRRTDRAEERILGQAAKSWRFTRVRDQCRRIRCLRWNLPSQSLRGRTKSLLICGQIKSGRCACRIGDDQLPADVGTLKNRTGYIRSPTLPCGRHRVGANEVHRRDGRAFKQLRALWLAFLRRGTHGLSRMNKAIAAMM